MMRMCDVGVLELRVCARAGACAGHDLAALRGAVRAAAGAAAAVSER